MSLWVADVGLKAASLNYPAIFIHTREQNLAYSLFDPPSPEALARTRSGGPMDPAFTQFIERSTPPLSSLTYYDMQPQATPRSSRQGLPTFDYFHRHNPAYLDICTRLSTVEHVAQCPTSCVDGSFSCQR
ncbi:hypothetical protein CPC08DRAFT_770992 [Agrocybe pediades]|nr:hypothetical protein CPC08DRAFT_770992 [Agrocybe pediades]